MNNIFLQFKQFMQNPQQYMRQMGIPADKIQSPNDVIEYLMKTGKVTQSQYNQAAQMANSMKEMFK